MQKKTIAITLLVIGTLFWGMTFVFVKEAVNNLNVYAFLAYRFIIAAMCLMMVFYKRLKGITNEIVYKGVLLSIPLCIGFVTQTIGVKYTSASNAGFITGLSVVFVPLLEAFINRQRPHNKSLLAMIMATVGLALITLSQSLNLNVGDLWILICAVAFAVYILMVDRESGRIDAVLLTLVQLSVVGLFSLFMAIYNGVLTVPVGYLEWRGILFCALFATTFMYTVQNHYQQYLSTTTTAIIFSLEPLFAALTAFIVIDEDITIKMVCGGVLMIAGMIYSELPVDKKSSFAHK